MEIPQKVKNITFKCNIIFKCNKFLNFALFYWSLTDLQFYISCTTSWFNSFLHYEMITIINLVTICLHTKLLQCYWLYSPVVYYILMAIFSCCILHPHGYILLLYITSPWLYSPVVYYIPMAIFSCCILHPHGHQKKWIFNYFTGSFCLWFMGKKKNWNSVNFLLYRVMDVHKLKFINIRILKLNLSW